MEAVTSSIEGTTTRTEKAVVDQAAELELVRMKSWLGLQSVVSPSNYEDALKLRHDGTGTWFLNEYRFQKWLGMDNGLMWLHGIRESTGTGYKLIY